ncbi:MAG: hypothetical protein AAF709_19810 [Pseudomonadota bacterium]
MNLNEEVRKQITADPTATNAGIAAAINADPAFWPEFAVRAFVRWLPGRQSILEAFAATANPSSDTDEALTLKDGIKAIMLAASSPSEVIDSAPGSRDRTLIESLVVIPGIVQSDVDELLASARPAGWVDATEASVGTARAENAHSDALTAYSTAQDAIYQAAVEAAQNTRDTNVEDYEAELTNWDGTGSPPEAGS